MPFKISTEHGVVTVTTNRIPRPLVTWRDLTEAQRAEVDYIDEGERREARLFIYRGSVYDLSEFESAHGNGAGRGQDWILASGFDAWQTESAFSAVVVSHFDRDGYEYGDCVVVGYAHW